MPGSVLGLVEPLGRVFHRGHRREGLAQHHGRCAGAELERRALRPDCRRDLLHEFARWLGQHPGTRLVSLRKPVAVAEDFAVDEVLQF